ncbi:MAG: hypothetical protein AABW53_00140 [Nanoarchaeota archaeon]
MEKNIHFRAVIEVLGKPKEHVDSALKGYIQKLKEDTHYVVIKEELADLKKHEENDLWMVFAELEIKTASLTPIIDFCFEYMPSLIEIIEPHELKISSADVSSFLNDLQAKLHGVDMLAKQLKMENQILHQTTSSLLSNYIAVLLRQNNLTSEQLSKLTGVKLDMLEDFLDKLIDGGKIDLKEGIYFLKEEAAEVKHGRKRKKG